MTPEEAMRITMSIDQHFKDLEWDRKDIDQGLMWVTLTLAILTRYSLPLSNKKFSEVLHAIANALILVVEDIEREK